ncbi:olfactory receptor 13A1-like [Trichosurus vulpecula]|uniref:olfactory receptor 13A1-like n=1 Tax=Trichosurus vulpecula TaxID=9337 RepID=UPI00186B06DA|nr:olfactory receptor 13A1-like [Trichosurus vulpecula]
MALNNQTWVTEFILQGFSQNPHLEIFFFCLFLFFYALGVIGNSLIIASVWVTSGLHTPMYFFLINLALLDIICTTTVVPKLLENLVEEKKAISFVGCMTQVYVFSWALGSELLLFTAMAYDRYVAICRPLHYSTLMNNKICGVLVTGLWIVGGLDSGMHTAMLAQLSFCGPNIIDHFFCEIPPILTLSCSSTKVNELMTLVTDLVLGGTNFFLTTMSYGFIIANILKIRSEEGKKRAFSTCSSHLMVVTMYYFAVFCAYISPSASYSPEKGKAMAVLYTTLSPAVNPLIYTLRNKDVKAALRKLFVRWFSF